MEVVAAHVFGEGDGSTAGRIEVAVREVSGAELPDRLVIKMARPDLPATPLYADEVAVYTHLRDELEIETPRCFGARFEPESGRFGLALEDLTSQRAMFGNVPVDVPLESMRPVLAQVATVHGAV